MQKKNYERNNFSGVDIIHLIDGDNNILDMAFLYLVDHQNWKSFWTSKRYRRKLCGFKVFVQNDMLLWYSKNHPIPCDTHSNSSCSSLSLQSRHNTLFLSLQKKSIKLPPFICFLLKCYLRFCCCSDSA